jgi:integrase
VRPSSGWTDRTLLRWSDIEIINEGTDSELWFINRTEKTQDFGDDPAKYIIQKPVIPDLKRLKLLYKERGISDPEFIFCHTKNGARGAAQGEVIKSFRRQWENLLTQIGIPNPKHAPQSERLSPYSIRGFYITMRLRYGKMNIDQIASACNTSAAMVRRIYRDWDIEQETESLTKGIPNYDESRQRRESANVI